VDDQRRGRADSAEVSADIDDVGGREQDDERAQDVHAVPVLDVARQALAGDVANPAAGLLHGDQQRAQPEGRP